MHEASHSACVQSISSAMFHSNIVTWHCTRIAHISNNGRPGPTHLLLRRGTANTARARAFDSCFFSCFVQTPLLRLRHGAGLPRHDILASRLINVQLFCVSAPKGRLTWIVRKAYMLLISSLGQCRLLVETGQLWPSRMLQGQ